MIIYLAGSWKRREQIRGHADTLKFLGYEVTSGWLYSETKTNPTDLVWEPGTEVAEASRDLQESVTADLFIVDTIERSSTGGSDCELGAALARGVPVWVVGPKRNGYHHLAVKHFEGWLDLMTLALAGFDPNG
jgi:hypothetical protein